MLVNIGLTAVLQLLLLWEAYCYTQLIWGRQLSCSSCCYERYITRSPLLVIVFLLELQYLLSLYPPLLLWRALSYKKRYIACMHISTRSCWFEQQYGTSDRVIFQGAKLYLIYNRYCGQSSRSQLQCYRQSSKGLFIQLRQSSRCQLATVIQQSIVFSCRWSSKG